MHRLFGKKVEKAPAPSLGDCAGGINDRVKALDEKIKSLEDELRYCTMCSCTDCLSLMLFVKLCL